MKKIIVIVIAAIAALPLAGRSQVKLEWVGYMEGYNTVSAPAVARHWPTPTRT